MHHCYSRRDRVHQIVEDLVNLVEDVLEPCERRSLNPAITGFQGKGKTKMVVLPEVHMLDVEKVLLSVMPRLTNGKIDVSAQVSWVSDTPDQVGVQPGTDPFDFNDGDNGIVSCPGFFNCWALTPLDAGQGSVTASAPQYESAQWPIFYQPGAGGSLNASTGQPVSDL